MDLGIAGRRAIVCGSSKGLGLACATALAEAGVDVVLNARSARPLAQAVEVLAAKIGRPVASVAADVTTEAGRTALLAACPDPDILVTNAGGPAPGNFEDWGEAEWHDAVQANMIAPLQLIRATVGAMRARGWGRILNITSAAVKAPLPMLGLSTGARSGLTGAVASLARGWRRRLSGRFLSKPDARAPSRAPQRADRTAASRSVP
jgi:3-oxoacyl-[acyl-carrier protein] reductase